MTARRGTRLTFRCQSCERSPDVIFGDAPKERGRRVHRTGRTRVRYTDKGRVVQHEFRCDDCNHIGWSAHPDVERAPQEVRLRAVK